MNWIEIFGNGVKILVTDANDDIPDGVVTERIIGYDGHVYRSGTFEKISFDGQPNQWMYLIKVEPWPPTNLN